MKNIVKVTFALSTAVLLTGCSALAQATEKEYAFNDYETLVAEKVPTSHPYTKAKQEIKVDGEKEVVEYTWNTTLKEWVTDQVGYSITSIKEVLSQPGMPIPDAHFYYSSLFSQYRIVAEEEADIFGTQFLTKSEMTFNKYGFEIAAKITMIKKADLTSMTINYKTSYSK